MSTNGPRRIDRHTAEQLLRGTPVDGHADGAAAVADLLAAAAAPAREDELAGQPAALAAFRSARLGPVPQPRRRSVIKSALVTSLTFKVAGLTAALLTSGGVLAAALTGHLAPHSGPGPTVASTTSSHATASTHPATAGTTGAAGSGQDGRANRPAPTPSLIGLCHAYTARGGAPDNPAFTALVTAAGGRAKVSAYCAAVLNRAPGKPPTMGAPPRHTGSADPRNGSAHPTPTAHPTHAGGGSGHSGH
ncbi:MAG TPA: hypothetical protein VFW65_23670 [Pseudonocardiaceae bacterium]|nr:hypothetical protein [Pseudonocardiaceae bacterium]